MSLNFLLLALYSFSIFTPRTLPGQEPTVALPAPPSDAQALALAAGSIAKLTGGTAIRDVTLSGTATWRGTEASTATLRALGSGESRIDLTLPNGTRTEIRDASTGVPNGQWTNPDSRSGAIPLHNCLTDAAWFFPALGSLGAGSNVTLSYIGMENKRGVSVKHLRSSSYQFASLSNSYLQTLSIVDFYLDTGTMLPVAVTFSAHPDNDSNTNLPVEIEYSDYQVVMGVNVPMHIQRRQQGSLILDIYLSQAAFNTGLDASIFNIN